QNHAQVLKEYDEVSALELSRTEKQLFERAQERSRTELSMERYHDGLDHIRTRPWHEAEQALSAAVKYQPNAAHAPNARLQLARALVALGRQRDAIPMLIKLFEASPDQEVMDDAAILLADAHVQIEAYNDAKATLRSFIRRFP